MPFVPLGSRKRIEVILDDDKARLAEGMHTRDNEAVREHLQIMAGKSGYRFANHPICKGPIMGPPPPFATANKPWTSADDDPDGMAAMKDLEHAPQGGIMEGSHCQPAENMRRTRSTPALTRTLILKGGHLDEEGRTLGQRAREAANPASIECNRWKRMATVTQRDMEAMPELLSLQKREKPMVKKAAVGNGGLVNFPKYMLFENSNLKTKDFQRFVLSEEKARKENEERARAAQAGEVQDTPLLSPSASASRASASPESSEMLVPFGTASWGAPRMRGPPELQRQQWAGSSMPSGKSCRSSNPFRMG